MSMTRLQHNLNYLHIHAWHNMAPSTNWAKVPVNLPEGPRQSGSCLGPSADHSSGRHWPFLQRHCNLQKRRLIHWEDEKRDAAASMKRYERYIEGPSLSAVQIRSTSSTCLHVMRRLWVLMKFSIALAGIKTAAAICGDGGGLTTPPLALIRPAKERKLTEHILEGTILPRNVQYFHTGAAKQLAKFSTKCNIRREITLASETAC